jgi:hypothetical protein
MSLGCSRSPIHHACSDDGSLLAADARAERNGAKPSRAVVARGLRHIVLTYEGSADIGTQQEATTNSLVTMTGTASSSKDKGTRKIRGRTNQPPKKSAVGEVRRKTSARRRRTMCLDVPLHAPSFWAHAFAGPVIVSFPFPAHGRTPRLPGGDQCGYSDESC